MGPRVAGLTLKKTALGICQKLIQEVTRVGLGIIGNAIVWQSQRPSNKITKMGLNAPKGNFF